MYSEAQKKAIYKYRREHITQLRIDCQKETAERIKEAARRHGESLAAYILRLVDEDEARKGINRQEEKK